MSEIEVAKDEVRKQYTNSPFWFWIKMVVAGITGAGGYGAVEKWPVINQSTRIAESVEVVKNLPPDQLAALQGMQIVNLEKSLETFKVDIKEILKDDKSSVNAQLEKIEANIYDHTKSISRLEALVPRARANN